MPIINPLSFFWSGANSDGGNGLDQSSGSTIVSHYGQWKLVSVHSHGAYGRYLDIKTNWTADSQFWMFKVEGYLYNHTLFGGVTCGYSYGSGTILAKSSDIYFGNTSHEISTYRTGTGSNENICLKIAKSSGGYSEGQIDLWVWDFNAANSTSCLSIASHHSNNTSNVYG